MTPSGTDPVFARDKFLLRQKHLAISEKYFIWDEAGNTILFVERPAHFLRNLFAVCGGVCAAAVVGAIAVFWAPKSEDVVLPLLVILGVILTLVAVTIALSAKRHVTFYRDDSKTEPLLHVHQDHKFVWMSATYTVKDTVGLPLAHLTKNYAYNLFRKRWYVYGPDGKTLIATAREDSLTRSLLRRFRFLDSPFSSLGTHFNFIIVRGDSEDGLGQFNRQFTLLDRYVLDLSADRAQCLDRRIAVALGVMLDTGEHR